MCHFKLAAWVIRVTSPSKEVLLSFAHSWVLAGIYGVCLDRTYFVETENWKHCSKIIFKYVNSIMRLIFNEKVDKKWSLWDLWTVHLCTVYKRPVNSCGWRKKKKRKRRRNTFKCYPNIHIGSLLGERYLMHWTHETFVSFIGRSDRCGAHPVSETKGVCTWCIQNFFPF